MTLALDPHYRVQVWDMTGANFGPGNLLAEFEKAKNVGWADYLLDVPEAFFTINQDDPKILKLRGYKDNAHVRIYRNNDLVWGGFLGEWDANATDTIFYAYGYVAALYLLVSGWNTAYTNAQVNTIVSDAWTLAKTGYTSSLLGWVTTGTIETPVTTSGGGVAIVLPTYRMFYKRLLFLMREMAAFSIGDTTNTVMFEITPSGTFNFWKNRGVDANVRFEYGDGRIAGFSDSTTPILRRNDILAVGINPGDALLKQEVADAADILAKGRRMEPIFFSWVRDSTELDRVSKLRAAKAKRDVVDLSLRFFPNKVLPPGATGAPYKLSDRVTAKVNRGITNLDARYLVQGAQVFWVRNQERVRLMLNERSGS